MPVSGPPHARINAIVERQRGHITRAQLLAAGFSSSGIGRLVAGARLVRVHPSVYVMCPWVPVPFARETAALLACGPNALLSHASAAALWNLRTAPTDVVELTIASRRHLQQPGIRAHRTARLQPRDVRVEQGLPVTSPARTLLDEAATATAGELERQLDEALQVLRIVRPRELRDVVARAKGRPGAPLLARLLVARTPDTITQSEAERMFLRLVREAGLPEPETQKRISGFTADFLWRPQRVVFEIDGYLFHTSRSAFDRDRRKDLALKAAGFDPNRVSRDQVKNEPLVVLAHVAGALARAGVAVAPAR